MFDRDDNLLTILNNDSDDACRFMESYLEEELNAVSLERFARISLASNMTTISGEIRIILDFIF
ncbi:hypothetical protein J2S77_000915 [Alkalibacillus salilacus]|uniref:Uncharacterized protein n=1 Tax=Alkalibacillus salilacus TaxID=284582 RepID=A0ABT9VDA3_9BACI|nr:hypothetical protein [Alkalibacillus salilacus]